MGMRVTPGFDPFTEKLLDRWELRVLEDGTEYQEQVVAALTEEEATQAVVQALAERIGAVKAEAARRILLVAPEWMQRNLTARAAELALLFPGTRGDELPEPERTEYLAGQAVWGQIKAVRVASNAIEAALVAAAGTGGGPGLLAVDIAAGWPE